MSRWTEDELRSVEAAQEIAIAPVRRNGALRRPTPIWIVRAGDDLYLIAAPTARASPFATGPRSRTWSPGWPGC